MVNGANITDGILKNILKPLGAERNAYRLDRVLKPSLSMTRTAKELHKKLNCKIITYPSKSIGTCKQAYQKATNQPLYSLKILSTNGTLQTA
jgi:hypothetical protein